MNYSKKFNTTKKAIAEIQRLEKECAKLAKMDLCDWSITLEQHINDKNEEVARLKSEIVQFRKTQDYQSDKIGELQGEKREWIMDEAKYKKRIETFKLNAENASEIYRDQRNIISNITYETQDLGKTIIRQANEITELKAGV